jgi:leucyl/phenylalanyl-tRNA---protein transferase
VTVLDADGYTVTPEVVLQAYALRCFPMADGRRGRIAWYRPEERAVITWQDWTVPRSLAKVIRNRRPYRITADRAFPAVIAACAEREATWISPDIEALYGALHRIGHVHSVEAWDADDRLVGGLYGLALGGVFCGESMFSRADDASKICVVHLVHRLRCQGFTALDCQQQTPHMERFGCRLMSDRAYAALISRASAPRPFGAGGALSLDGDAPPLPG